MPLVVIGFIFFLIGGLVFKFFPPRKINHIYGWRTSFDKSLIKMEVGNNRRVIALFRIVRSLLHTL